MLNIISGEEYGFLFNYFGKYSGKYLTIIDAGANIGLFSLFIYKYLNLKKIILIEADKDNINSLYKNIEINGLFNTKYKIYERALYKNDSILLFDNTLDHHAKKVSNKGIKVKGITVGDIFEDNRLDYANIFKIDIEDSEWGLLQKQNKQYFSKCDLIILEYHLGGKFSNISTIMNYFKGWSVYKKIKNNKMGLLYFKNPRFRI